MKAAVSSLAEQAATAAMKARVHQAYAAHSRESVEEKRILEYLPLVRHVVQKIAGHFSHKVDLENLISAGTLGLVKAAKAFEPARDIEFKTYAYIRIRGSILDELRSESFVPTGVHKQIRLMQQAYQRLLGRSGNPPNDEELAAELGIDPERLYRTLEEARRQQFLSIHGLSADVDDSGVLMPVDRGEGPDSQVEREELLERLAEGIRQLSPRDRQMLLLYYERDLTMKEIAAVFEITESRVSQLHASALFKLSMKMRIQP